MSHYSLVSIWQRDHPCFLVVFLYFLFAFGNYWIKTSGQLFDIWICSSVKLSFYSLLHFFHYFLIHCSYQLFFYLTSLLIVHLVVWLFDWLIDCLLSLAWCWCLSSDGCVLVVVPCAVSGRLCVPDHLWRVLVPEQLHHGHTLHLLHLVRRCFRCHGGFHAKVPQKLPWVLLHLGGKGVLLHFVWRRDWLLGWVTLILILWICNGYLESWCMIQFEIEILPSFCFGGVVVLIFFSLAIIQLWMLAVLASYNPRLRWWNLQPCSWNHPHHHSSTRSNECAQP